LNLHDLTIHQAQELLASDAVTSVSLTEALLARIAAVDTDLHAYLHVASEQALAQAQEADERRARGACGALLGIPLAIKDVICTRGLETTAGSRILAGFRPVYDATVIAKLREAGAIILGKTNTDEFAMGSSTENSGYDTTRNPWDRDRVPGGSSGGSAAAVAASMCLGALGSDTGGSIRQPAAYCGVVGLKPTYGRVSRYGLIAFASSLDQIGPIVKDVTDAALLLQAIVGHDPQDATSVEMPAPNYAAALGQGVAGMRLGVPREYMVDGMAAGVRQAVEAALDVWRELGADIVQVSMPHAEYALPAYYLIAPAEASANLARFDGVRYGYSHPDTDDIWDAFRRTRAVGFGDEVKRRIMLGTYALSAGYYDAYYLKAQKVRTLIKRDYDEALQQCDALIAPTTPNIAFRIGELIDDPLQMYLEDIFTLALNLAGVCGISIPCGLSEGMPVGLQVQGRAFDEATILRVAYAYEQATDWHMLRPQV